MEEAKARVDALIVKKKKYSWQDYESVKTQLHREGIFGYEWYIAELMKL